MTTNKPGQYCNRELELFWVPIRAIPLQGRFHYNGEDPTDVQLCNDVTGIYSGLISKKYDYKLPPQGKDSLKVKERTQTEGVDTKYELR